MAGKECKGLVVAGLAGGSGKSVVSVGLTAVFAATGRNVVPFKKGPDYIDAGWLQLASRKNCYNLDPFLVDDATLRRSFMERAAGAELALLEGNRGLYDGVTADGGYSTAELAVLLDLPVLLVVNCTKITRTVAAMVLGCMKLDERVDIRGVVLNHVATTRQKRIITEAVEKYTGVPVLGVIPRMERDVFPMRHLGMIPHQEYENSGGALDLLRKTVEDNVDIERIESIMTPVKVESGHRTVKSAAATGEKVRVGIIRDAAFQFYYTENLEALEREGAELVPLNAFNDSALPPLDGLYIGGGFPETSARELAANEGFRTSVKAAAENGLPIYAECGGLIYLGESLELDGVQYPLAGVFPARFSMSRKPQAHGYSIFTVDRENPFYPLGTRVKGHEFRYSVVQEWGEIDGTDMVLKMERGKGFRDGRDGLCRNNVLALYTHVHADGSPVWAKGFVDRCRRFRKESRAAG